MFALKLSQRRNGRLAGRQTFAPAERANQARQPSVRAAESWRPQTGTASGASGYLRANTS